MFNKLKKNTKKVRDMKKGPEKLIGKCCKKKQSKIKKKKENKRKKKKKVRGHPDLNQGPLDLQSNALPLSYTPSFREAEEGIM